MRLIIVGGVAAGTKAAAKAKRVNPDLNVVIYQQEAEVAYSSCGQPYALSGVIANSQKLRVRTVTDFADSGIQVFTKHQVSTIDPINKQITVLNLDTQHYFTDSYDRLILATGASTIRPNLTGINTEGVLTLRSWAEFTQFQHTLTTLKPRRAIIIGTGYISLELAETLTSLAIHTTIIGRSPQVLSHFDAEMAEHVSQHLLEHNVELIMNSQISKILTEHNRVVGVVTDTGHHLESDMVIFAIGIKPNIALAQQVGIQLGSTGAIKVNEYMATNLTDIYAAGDCCETLHRVSNTPIWQPLGDLANLQGRVAGENAAGGNAIFHGCLGTAILKTFDFNSAMTGLTEKVSKQHGFETIAVEVKAPDRARYYPNVKYSTFKLIAEKHTGKILGAQAVGKGASDKLIDIIATALLGKLTCFDLENADFAYSPPFSPVLSPVIVAAGLLAKKAQ